MTTDRRDQIDSTLDQIDRALALLLADVMAGRITDAMYGRGRDNLNADASALFDELDSAE